MFLCWPAANISRRGRLVKVWKRRSRNRRMGRFAGPSTALSTPNAGEPVNRNTARCSIFVRSSTVSRKPVDSRCIVDARRCLGACRPRSRGRARVRHGARPRHPGRHRSASQPPRTPPARPRPRATRPASASAFRHADRQHQARALPAIDGHEVGAGQPQRRPAHPLRTPAGTSRRPMLHSTGFLPCPSRRAPGRRPAGKAARPKEGGAGTRERVRDSAHARPRAA